jgi:putative serine protease PepD
MPQRGPDRTPTGLAPQPDPDQPEKRPRRARGSWRPSRTAVALALVVLLLIGTASALVYQQMKISDLGRQLRAVQREDVADRDRDELLRDRANAIGKRVDALSSRLTAEEGKRIDVGAVAAKVKDSVVTISATGSQGTGFVVGLADGTWIATNFHVIDKNIYEGQRTVTVHQGSQRWQGEVWSWYESDDIALVKVTGADLPHLEWASRGSTKVGDPIMVYGSPYGLENTITSGVVSALRGPDIQTDAAINSGNSGGPALNGRGEVVGIATLGIRPELGSGIGIAIAIHRLCKLLEGGECP